MTEEAQRLRAVWLELEGNESKRRKEPMELETIETTLTVEERLKKQEEYSRTLIQICNSLVNTMMSLQLQVLALRNKMGLPNPEVTVPKDIQ